MKKTLLTLASVAIVCATLLSGCQKEKEVVTTSKEGQILLAVNPEILISYDENSLVTGIEGKNVDGQSIVTNYPDYIGKKCDEVLRDLVVLIKDAGYFVEDIDGQKKNIVIKIEADSYIPNGDFLNDLENAVLSTKDEGTNVVTVDRDDYDDRYVSNDYISYDKAKEIALEHAKVAENSLIFDKVEKDYEDHRLVYEVEFVTNDGMEYDYEIDASSGTIVKYDFDAEYYAPSGTSRSRRQNGSSQAADASQISEDDAKRIALEQAGISEKQASYLHVKKDWDDGYVLYEGKFFYNELEYEFEIDAQTGRILEWDVESIYD